MAELPVFRMPFDPMTINHLGLRLYSTLPPVISELVSNSYDADSPRVEVTVPTGKITQSSEVIVRDWGHGMDASSLQDEYLPIGRNRRGSDSEVTQSKRGKRHVTGRKGLGKLSAFGVAKEVEVRTIKKGHAICLRISLDSMMEWANTHAPNEPFEPTVVPSRSGKTTDKEGVEVRLRKLHRKRAIDPDELRRGLAKRLHVIGTGFSVKVNGIPVSAKDRVRRTDCAAGFSWDVEDLPNKGAITPDYTVHGWVGFTKESSQIGRGINLVANHKAVELGSYFNLSTTHAQFARAYLVGEVHADFLDGDEDLVSTARNSVVWESDLGQSLQEWGQEALKWAFERWKELRESEKNDTLIKAGGFDKWLQGRTNREQKTAMKMVRALIRDPKIESESAIPLLEIVKSSVESVFFQELVEAIEEEGTTPSALLGLFDEWRLIEARTLLRLADGRIEAMAQLKKFIDEGGLEVQELQPLLEKNLWLLNPKWAEADGQSTYTGLLRKNCIEPKDYDDVDRRIDIIGVSAGSALTVVEIKRPEKKVNRKDLDQLARYVDWARTQLLGRGEHSPKYVGGLLIVGSLSNAGDVQLLQERLAGDGINVETYRDLHTAAREYYGHAQKVLKHLAPEYASSRTRGAKTDKPNKPRKKAKSAKKPAR